MCQLHGKHVADVCLIDTRDCGADRAGDLGRDGEVGRAGEEGTEAASRPGHREGVAHSSWQCGGHARTYIDRDA